MKHVDTNKPLTVIKKVANISLLIMNLMSFLQPGQAFAVPPLFMRHFSTFATIVDDGAGSCCKNISSFRSIYSSSSSSRLQSLKNDEQSKMDSSTETIIEHNNENKNDDIHQAMITFETKSKQQNLTIQKGEILRTALMKRGISPHNGNSRLINCRGLGTCGTCAVEVTTSSSSNNKNKNAIEPMERNMKERIRLNFPPHGSKDQSSNLRLACQIQVQGDIHVTKKAGFWGQSDEKDDLAMDYEAKTYFGELEYVLDDKSPISKT